MYTIGYSPCFLRKAASQKRYSVVSGMYVTGFARSLILCTLANLYDLCGCVGKGLLISSFHPRTVVVLICHIYMFHQMKHFVLPCIDVY